MLFCLGTEWESVTRNRIMPVGHGVLLFTITV